MDLKGIRVNKRKTKTHFSIKKQKGKKNQSNTVLNHQTKRKRKSSYFLKIKSQKSLKLVKRKVKKKTASQQRLKTKHTTEAIVLKKRKTHLKRKRKNSLT